MKSDESVKIKNSSRHTIIPQQFRKRKIVTDTKEEPVSKQRKSLLNLFSKRKETNEKNENEEVTVENMEDEEIFSSNGEEEKCENRKNSQRNSHSERVKRQNKEERTSAFNNLVSLMRLVHVVDVHLCSINLLLQMTLAM